MANRGWDVDVVFDKPDKRGPDVVLPSNAGPRVRSLGALPGSISPFAKNLRIAIDCIRYLEPAFARADYLRRRAEKELGPSLGFIKQIGGLPRSVVSAAIGIARLAERFVPVDRTVVSFLRDVQPDVVVVSPVVMIGGSGVQETEVVKAARALRIPCAVGVASWDHLTSKGLIRVVPDAVMVWNAIQAQEVERLHRISRQRVMITGAQSMDRWFERPRPGTIEAFRRSLGIDAGRRVVLLVGSSRNMAPGDSEVDFARRWIAALRTSACHAVREAFVIVRPHPGNVDPWRSAQLNDRHAVVHPKTYASKILTDDAEVDTFWHTLLASDAVVGINTTAMIEAAIVGRPVLSVRDAAFAHSQGQTLHFGYLPAPRGGFVTIADTLDDHLRQIEHVLSRSEPDLAASKEFVNRFVRPLGMSTSATQHVSDAIERLARAHTRASVTSDASLGDTSDAISPGR